MKVEALKLTENALEQAQKEIGAHELKSLSDLFEQDESKIEAQLTEACQKASNNEDKSETF